MIKIGLTGWGDHPSLYRSKGSSKDKLYDYSSHFPIVEVDTSFYAIPSKHNIEKWIAETPEHFQFVVKAYQGMTGHLRDDIPFESKEEMFSAFKEAAQTFQEAGKLALVLVQFPPWFDCKKSNVDYIRYVKQQLKDFPIAIEFRNQTWYSEKWRDNTLQFLKQEHLCHTVCDEPQAGVGSVPLVPVATADKVLLRIHGRNIYGWRNPGNSEQWRKVRFLYDYNQEELLQLKEAVEDLQQQCKEVYVLFNNNSGHHAAKNAHTLKEMLGIEFEDLSPKQLDLFEGE
ncbi:DUF72 domain-containing protein [Rummeliibacillus stabekisii]|uniref:Uncharacterized protein n=1 Tax=Rummeliibacillus stabekisii TaxID=241244 RepID=A0A143HDA7_9BACL|nr:DUF72 domain-containing protein [Rummeliibacillus stabekisii]AMW99724.1 hypothetical protein ATY39_09900 [Rummeliibacillus stabekisii]